VFIITTLVIDCNNFFYKYLAWIPAEHQLVKYRVVLWGLVAVATSKEWYEYVSNPQCHRPGPFVWLSFYVSAIELSSIYKFRGNEFQNPFPWWINLMWTVLAAIFLLGLLKSYKNGRNKVTRQFNPYNPEIDIIKLK
jgi:phosphatidylserine synthase 2